MSDTRKLYEVTAHVMVSAITRVWAESGCSDRNMENRMTTQTTARTTESHQATEDMRASVDALRKLNKELVDALRALEQAVGRNDEESVIWKEYGCNVMLCVRKARAALLKVTP